MDVLIDADKRFLAAVAACRVPNSL
jgi:hypothetical protein